MVSARSSHSRVAGSNPAPPIGLRNYPRTPFRAPETVENKGVATVLGWFLDGRFRSLPLGSRPRSIGQASLIVMTREDVGDSMPAWRTAFVRLRREEEAHGLRYPLCRRSPSRKLARRSRRRGIQGVEKSRLRLSAPIPCVKTRGHFFAPCSRRLRSPAPFRVQHRP